MVYRTSPLLKGKKSPINPFNYGAQTMDISHPLRRASSVAEIIHAEGVQSKQKQQRRSFSSLTKYVKPRRNVFYISGKQSFKYMLIPARPLTRAPYHIKNKTRNLKNRFFSTEARQKRQQQRRFIRWWTLTSITVVLGSVAAKIKYDRGIADDEEINEYKIKPQSWHLYAYSTLPLKAISRLWGQVNSITLPVWLRSPTYKLYSKIFGVNLHEMDEPNLKTYPNLGEFFYRKLKPGVRPINSFDLVSPSDGKILGFGVVEDGEIEQVKGMTYSVDALLGMKREKLAAPSHSPDFDFEFDDSTMYSEHEEFAKNNGINHSKTDFDDIDLNTSLDSDSDDELRLDFQDGGDGTAAGSKSTIENELKVAKNLTPTKLDNFKSSDNKQLYFAVIYLAPGDYHRFHSPTNWVTTLRRHFIGELFSVAPFFQKTLQGLFVLNERVALLGYWKYGFFSMIPVGATNVGSIIVNFDKDLKTNERYESSIYSATEKSPLLDRDSEIEDDIETVTSNSVQSAKEKKKRLKKNTVYEATYTKASRLLGGYPVSKGQEIGGFKLGSTVVLVFEAPDNFKFELQNGQKVKLGQPLGRFVSQS